SPTGFLALTRSRSSAIGSAALGRVGVDAGLVPVGVTLGGPRLISFIFAADLAELAAPLPSVVGPLRVAVLLAGGATVIATLGVAVVSTRLASGDLAVIAALAATGPRSFL